MSRAPESRSAALHHADPRGAQLDARFRNVGFVKAHDLLDLYQALPAQPATEGDRALQQRQAMLRVLITHYALLRRQLPSAGAVPEAEAAMPGVIDEAALRAIIGDEDGDAA